MTTDDGGTFLITTHWQCGLYCLKRIVIDDVCLVFVSHAFDNWGWHSCNKKRVVNLLQLQYWESFPDRIYRESMIISCFLNWWEKNETTTFIINHFWWLKKKTQILKTSFEVIEETININHAKAFESFCKSDTFHRFCTSKVLINPFQMCFHFQNSQILPDSSLFPYNNRILLVRNCTILTHLCTMAHAWDRFRWWLSLTLQP